MLLKYEIADYTIRNLIGQLDNIFAAPEQSLSYNIMDADGNVTTVDVDSWSKIKSEVRTDLIPINDINNVLLGYISFVDNISTISGLPETSDINDAKMVLSKDTKSIFTKNQYGNVAQSLDSTEVSNSLISIMKNSENIIFNTVAPTNDVGVDGSIYVDNANANIYYKNNGAWANLIKSLDKTETPILDDTSDMLEMSTKTIGIKNFNKNAMYYIHVSQGEAEIKNNGTIVYSIGSLNSDIRITLEVAATEDGKLRSNIAKYSFNVLNIPVVTDDVIVDNNFSINADSQYGIKY